jgi:hypothetical protein
MKYIVVFTAALMVISTSASARTVRLKGDKAVEAFIQKYFPEASIPGPVSGPFKYVDSRGRRRKGDAVCDVPAMGARSDGAVSVCTIHYN